MTTQRRTLVVDDDGLRALRQPRDGILLEAPDPTAPDLEFTLVEGPFHSYRRTLHVDSGSDGTHTVVETVEWRLAIPFWWPLFWLPVRFHIRSGMENPTPWWAPAGRLTARAAHVIGLLSVLAVVTGYLGTVIGQTLTFAADEFCEEFERLDGSRRCIDPRADESARANVFSAVRVSVLFALAMTGIADRYGRRRTISVAVLAGCVATVAGSLAPTLPVLAGTQVVARGLATGLSIVIAVVAAEELPARSRAYGVSVLVLAAGIGSGMVVWVLPLADVAAWGWRLVYAVPIVFLPAAAWAAIRLPVTRRFAQAVDRGAVPSWRVLGSDRGLRARLALLAGSALLLLVFASPASQFHNQFLRDEQGFSATEISIFTLITSTPIGIGVLAGGILADRIGRRITGALGLGLGVGFGLWSYFASGPSLWVLSSAGVILGGLATPALGVYGPELFPTRLRSTANGVITATGVVGTVVGLQVVGRLAERWDAFGPALAVTIAGPALLVLLVLFVYPETANLTLETINHEPELDEP